MDISRAEQRILHLLAQGGRIDIEKDDNRKIITVACITRDGWRAGGLDLDLFRKLKRRRCIASCTVCTEDVCHATVNSETQDRRPIQLN